MKISFSEAAKSDLVWFRFFYGSVFPSGAANATSQFRRAFDNLHGNPFIGHPVGDKELRELSVPRTPFSIIYRVLEDRIQIARIWDQRGDQSESGFHEDELT